jgi:SAM-dependent methyltransferase
MSIDYTTEFYTKIKPNYLSFEENLPEYWDMKYRDRWLQISEIVKRKDIKILDVGCGVGRAMWHFKQYGAEVIGVEPGDWAVEHSRLEEDEIVHGDFLLVDIKDKFDVVYFEQVLSHMPDYRQALVKARGLLKDDGILVIEEPNDYNPLQMVIAQERGIYWITNDHCNYFSHAGISQVLELLGCDVVYRSCTWPMELFYLQGIAYLGDEELGKYVHKLRYNILSKLSYEMRCKLKEGFARLNMGRDLFVIAKKKGDSINA